MNDWNRQIEAYREFFGTAEIRSKYGCVDGLSVFSHVLIAYSKASWSGVPVYEMLGVVNGQNSDLPLFLSEFWLLSELDILEHLDTMNEVSEIVEQGFEITDSSAIKPYIWTHSWFPFAMDCFGEVLCLDYDPGSTGTQGQVIKVWHDIDKKLLLSNSLSEFLSNSCTPYSAKK